jgi:hypothetical protein
MENFGKKILFLICDREPRKWRVKMLRLCRSGGGKIIETVTISKMKETEAYTWMEKHVFNTIWNMAFEKIRFGRRV